MTLNEAIYVAIRKLGSIVNEDYSEVIRQLAKLRVNPDLMDMIDENQEVEIYRTDSKITINVPIDE